MAVCVALADRATLADIGKIPGKYQADRWRRCYLANIMEFLRMCAV